MAFAQILARIFWFVGVLALFSVLIAFVILYNQNNQRRIIKANKFIKKINPNLKKLFDEIISKVSRAVFHTYDQGYIKFSDEEKESPCQILSQDYVEQLCKDVEKFRGIFMSLKWDYSFKQFNFLQRSCFLKLEMKVLEDFYEIRGWRGFVYCVLIL